MLAALFLLICAPALRAQFVEIYGTLGDLHTNNTPTSVPCYTQIVSCSTILGTASTNGINGGGGVTLNLLNAGVVKLGLDLRGSKHIGTDGADLGLAGAKLTIAPPVIRIKPYIEAAAGYLGTSTTTAGSTRTAKYFATEILGGIDLPILPALDFRMIEVGAGRALNSDGGTSPTFVTVNTGLVLHF